MNEAPPIQRTQETWSDDFQASPQQLEAELRRAWQRALRADDRTLYRGMTLNLITAAPVAMQDEVEQALERLLVRHPTRAFVVLLDEEATDPTMRVHVRVREERNSRQLVLERIMLRSAPHDRGLVRSILVPSRLDDLPTLLFWPGDTRHGEVLHELAGIADHVAVDTTAFGGCDGPRQSIGNDSTQVIDLAWFRLRPWRRALAEAFEKFAWQPKLGIEVTLRHRDRPAERCSAELIGRWLEERLQADVAYEPLDTREGPAHQPLSLQLRNGPSTTVSVEHQHPDAHLLIKVETDGVCKLPFQAVASRGAVGDLLAAAADRCS